ncbi:sensor histidine kinase [Streptomyces oceani]|uniref:sensor histidine kinase n=1 Tax=Streptomyces oceani TaxID=1075402 RepID=UPI0008725263|nr:sensor histidine kinase [Streptomyces oceani]
MSRLLSWCLHLLVAGLLALTVGRALAERPPDAFAVLVAATLLGACYAAGPLLGPVGRSVAATRFWLAMLGGCWLGLLALTPDGVWLAFPLYFLQLHLLPRRLGLGAVVVTAGAAVLGFAAQEGGLALGTTIGPTLGAAVAVAVVLGYQSLSRESEQRQALIEELTAARADLAAADHAAGVTAERERLAREIHDTLAQGLSSIQLLLRAAERSLPEDAQPAGGYVSQARQAAQDNLAEARRFVAALAPPGLDGGTLVAALQRLCDTTGQRHDLTVRFHVSGTPASLPVAHEVALLRIAQSALANTVRHAHAREVEVTLSYMDTRTALDVVDDGVGFTPSQVPSPTDGGGFGLATIRARARALEGGLTVESAPGHGTALAVLLPAGSAPGGDQRADDQRADDEECTIRAEEHRQRPPEEPPEEKRS